MASFNKIILVGNLTRDPELKYTQSQVAICNFGLAVNEKFKTASGEERENVLFIDCAAFKKTAETINQYMQKGSPILIEGKLKLESWEDRESGQKRSKHTVTVNSFQFLPTRDGGDGERGGDRGRSSAPQKPRADKGAPQSPFSEEQHFTDDDIPF